MPKEGKTVEGRVSRRSRQDTVLRCVKMPGYRKQIGIVGRRDPAKGHGAWVGRGLPEALFSDLFLLLISR